MFLPYFLFVDSLTSGVSLSLGYIGGSILKRLLSHPNRRDFEITALVRNADKAELLETQFGVKTVIGSLQDLDKLTTLVERAHIIINTVSTMFKFLAGSLCVTYGLLTPDMGVGGL